MPAFRLEPFFKRRLKRKPHQLQGAVLQTIQRLAEDPKHPGLHSHRVQGTRDVWEAYVDDANRVTFHWDGPTIVLRNHCNHDIVSKRP